MRNTNTLYDKTRNLTFTADEIANGARGLLDEVATGKVTGEEEYWSRTDLWDFQANVDGARVGFEGLRPLLTMKDPALDSQIDARFDALQRLLDAHKSDAGFVTYEIPADMNAKLTLVYKPNFLTETYEIPLS